jgi:hypothetical protein
MKELAKKISLNSVSIDLLVYFDKICNTQKKLNGVF